jgi:preprotein translocase subunit SecY
VAGAMFVTWLAHQITARGIGDGALLILACSVVSWLPYNLIQAFEAVRMGAVGIAAVLGVLLMMAAFLAVVVFVESAEHHVSLNNPENRTVESSRLGSYRKVLLRINPAGVVPALAAAIFVTPLLQSIEAIDWLKVVIGRYIGAGTFDLVYGALLVLFAAYFNVAMLNPRSTVRRPTESPDDDAADTHAHRMQSLHVALGTCYVAAVCMLPLLIYRWTVWPFLLSGFQIFLLGWVMTRILEQVRAS